MKRSTTPVEVAGRSPVVTLRNTGAGSPLFCLPGGGGNVHIFDEMVAALPAGRPVYAIDMESLSDSDQEFTIEQLAPIYLEIIRNIQARGPYYFCGYSFGGLLAYEMAIGLLRENDCANLVAILDAANPAMLSNLSQTDAAHFQKTYIFDRLKKYGRNLVRGDIKEFAGRGSAFLVGRLGKLLAPIIKKGYRLVNRPLPGMIRSNDPVFLNAWKAYVPKRYLKGLVLFRVEDRGPEYDRDPSMGWNGCVAGGVEIHIVPGSHVEMMNMPSVRVMAEKLAMYLNDGSHLGDSGM